MAQTRGSEPDSFRSIYNRALPRVYSYLHQRIGADAPMTVAMTRATFDRLAGEWPIIDEDPSTRALAIARDVLVDGIIDASRRRARRRRPEGDSHPLQTTDHEASLHDAIRTLDPIDRLALLLTYTDLVEPNVAAAALDLPEGEVPKAANRALAELQESLRTASLPGLVRRLRELDRPVVVPDGLSSEIYNVVADEAASREGRLRPELHDIFMQLAPLQTPELPRWRPGVMLMVLLFAGGAIAGVWTLGGRDSTVATTVPVTEQPAELEVLEAAPAPVPAPRRVFDLPEGPPGWIAVDPGPMTPQTPSVVAATDRELVVWTSERMAAYSPTTAAWHAITAPPAPFVDGARLLWAGSKLVAMSPGADMAAIGFEGDWTTVELPGGPLGSVVASVWDGTEAIVLGKRAGSSAALAFSPASDTWTELTPPDSTFETASAAWVGERVMVIGATAADPGKAIGVVYDPTTDLWRDMPPASVGVEGVDAAAVAGRLVAVDASLRSAAFSVESGWLPLESIPVGNGECPVRLAAAGDVLVASLCGDVAIFDPALLQWSRVAVPDVVDAPVSTLGQPLALGGMVYFWDTTQLQPVLWSFAPLDAIPGGSSTGVDGWSVLPPGAFDGIEAEVVSIGDGSLLAWVDAPFQAQVYEAKSDDWRAIESPGGTATASAWTGSRLVLFDDSESVESLDPLNATWDDALTYPSMVGTVAGAAWTGEELLAWGREGVASLGHDAIWRRLSTRAPATPTWSGFDLVSVESTLTGIVASRFDESSGQWVEWEAGGDVIDIVAWVAAPRAVFVAGVADAVSLDEERVGRLWFLDTSSGAWHLVPDPPIDVASLEPGDMVWTGSRLAVWDTSNRNPVVWLYNPLSAEWSSTAFSPLQAPDAALSWAEDRIVVTGTERVLTYELGSNGATLPALPGFDVALDLEESIPLTLYAFDPVGDVGGSAAVIDLFAGLRTEYGPGEHQVEPPDQAAGLPSGGFAALRDGRVTLHPAALYRSGSSIWSADDHARATIVAATLPGGGDGVWIVEAAPGEDGGPVPVRLVSSANGEIQLNSELAANSTPVQATAAGLVVDLIDFLDTANGPVPDPETAQMALLEPGGRLVPLGDGIGVAIAGDTIVRLVCPGLVERECALRLTVPGAANESVAAPGGTTWAPFAQPGASLASPNGRWAIAAASENSDVDRKLLPVLVNVELARAEVLPYGQMTDHGLSVVWSADSRWLVVLGGAPMAYNVEQGRWLSLDGVVPEGLVVYAAN